MENASKALIMSAGVLVGVLVLSLAVYLFISFGRTASETNKQIAEQQLEQFNAQFTSYEGRTDITIYDVVTVANLAKENNEYYGLKEKRDDNYYIMVNIVGNSLKLNIENYSVKNKNNLLKDEIMVNVTENGQTFSKLPRYTCYVTINSKTKRVAVVNFKKV